MNSSHLNSHKRMLALLACGAALCAAPVFAQTDTPPSPPAQTDGQPPQPPFNGPRRGGPDQRAQMLQRQLNLSTDQTAQVRSLFETERAHMMAMHQNTALSPQDMHTQMMAMHQGTETKLRGLLTPDQATKYDALVAQQRARMQERQGESQGPPPPPPAGAPQL